MNIRIDMLIAVGRSTINVNVDLRLTVEENESIFDDDPSSMFTSSSPFSVRHGSAPSFI